MSKRASGQHAQRSHTQTSERNKGTQIAPVWFKMPDKAFHSILFPVDFSVSSEATAPHVRYIAEQSGATVVLLHVIPWLSAWYSVTELRPAILGDPDLRRLEEYAQVSLETFREKYFSGIPSHREVQSGAVAETIVDRAASWGVDLIMMPTRGLGRSRPFLIGSTTAKVLHDAMCSVWTSPHLGDAEPGPYKNVLCTVDRDEIPRGYLEEATRLATCFESKLNFVTAVPSYVGGTGDEHTLRHLTTEFPQAEVHQCDDPSSCSIITETGSVGDVIRKVAETHAIDLVVTNRGHLHEPSGRFLSHVYEIVLEARCPVLSLCIHVKKHARETLEVSRAQAVGL
ncbi:MAG: universal stress protein [Bryobacteraceae bacterium]